MLPSSRHWSVLPLNHYFGCNLSYAKGSPNLCWLNDMSFRSGFCVIQGLNGRTPGLGGGIHGLGRHLDLLLAHTYTSYFWLVSRNYLTSGCFSWCKLSLFVHSRNSSPCSNPGLASLSYTVKIQHPRHSTFCSYKFYTVMSMQDFTINISEDNNLYFLQYFAKKFLKIALCQHSLYRAHRDYRDRQWAPAAYLDHWQMFRT